jgi:hypothetical protein
MASFGLIVARLDPPAEIDAEFNDWYETEHIPERLAVPGFLNARRGQRDQQPRYVATYDLDNLAVLESQNYLSVTGNNRSAWTARMLRTSNTFDRIVYEQVAPGRELIDTEHTHLVLRKIKGGDVSALQKHLEEVRKLPDRTARLFLSTTLDTPEHLVYYTAASEEIAKQCAAMPAGGEVLEFSFCNWKVPETPTWRR